MTHIKEAITNAAKEPLQYEYVIATNSGVSSGLPYNPLFARKQQAPICYLDDKKVADWMTVAHEYWDFEEERWVVDNDLDKEFDMGETDLEMPGKRDFFKRLGMAQAKYDKSRPTPTAPDLPSAEDSIR